MRSNKCRNGVAYRKGIDWLRRRRLLVSDSKLARDISTTRIAPPPPPRRSSLDAWLHGTGDPLGSRDPGSDAFRHVLRRAMARLRPIHAEVVRMHYLLGYDTARLGILLGRPRSAIKMRLFRARAALRELVAEEVQHLAPAERRVLREHLVRVGGVALFPTSESG